MSSDSDEEQTARIDFVRLDSMSLASASIGGARVEPPAAAPTCVDGRYDVLAFLGRGGMADVYRVHDRATDRQLALKRVIAPGRAGTGVELFEREFHTLTQLAHPRIVRAFDYGFDDEHPYYTMELLDGGDLRELAPLPWQQVCAIAYDICAALSLLHSRRLVHRDLTPRNVRRTADGTAKLIDFGLLDIFGPSSVMAGTPPYVAPELVNKVSLDARSDLFSLGATLYFALTGLVAFRVSRFSQLREAWRGTPMSPRKLVPEIPQAVDTLVMSLLRIDVGSRPKSAAEVMDRIAPLLAKAPDETLRMAGAFLTAPQQVGRDEMVNRMRKQVMRSHRGRGGGFLVVGDAGTGRTRALDSFVLEAKLMGGIAVRSGANDATGPFGVARSLAQQVFQDASSTSIAVARGDKRIWSVLFGDAAEPQPGQRPALLDIGRPELPRAEVQAALRDWLLGVAAQRPLAIAVDDVELVDAASAALLAALALEAARHRLSYGISVRGESLRSGGPALVVLREQAHEVALAPLTHAQVRQLLAGVFGDVDNLDALSHQLYELSAGRPRECMAIAQHLVNENIVEYSGGAFRLPVSIDPSMLPPALQGSLEAKVKALSAPAMMVGRLLSLSVIGQLGRAQLAELSALSHAELDRIIDELRGGQIIVGSPQGYRVCHPAMAGLLFADLDGAELRRLHGRLAETLGREDHTPLVPAYHALQSENAREALDHLLAISQTAEERTALSRQGYAEIGATKVSELYGLAIAAAKAQGRSKREMYLLWPSVAGQAASGADASYYDLVAADWLAELKAVSGYHDWCALPADLDPPTRAVQAFIKATQRYEATPEAERVATPTDGIKELVAYVVFSIAVSARTIRPELAATLPSLLEPFSALSPVVNAMRLNAESTCCMAQGRRQEARERCIELIGVIDGIQGEKLAFMDQIRAAVCQAIATQEAVLGIRKPDPDAWLQLNDPNQRVGAEYIRKINALHRGDWEAAEEHRRRAELIALQHDARSMFTTLAEELETHALARDLPGVRAVRARIRDLAKTVPPWEIVAMVADVYYHHLRGEPDLALSTIELVRSVHAARGGPLRLEPLVETVAVEILLARGEHARALEVARAALEVCERARIVHMSRTISLALALSEAHNGAYDAATARIERVIAEQKALGVAGLLLGRSYELLARCAIAVGDREGFRKAAQAAAEEYRPGASGVLSGLYERLLEDARAAGVVEGSEARAVSSIDLKSQVASRVHTTLMRCHDSRQRAESSLALLLDAKPSDGHLYLLTERGLELAASSGVNARATREMAEFAQAQIDLELDNDACTMTAGPLGGDAFVIHSRVSDAQSAFQPVVLMGERDGNVLIVGVALLREGTADDERLGPVAAAVAKYLIDSNEYRPLQAA